jgi:hypothetical protein
MDAPRPEAFHKRAFVLGSDLGGFTQGMAPRGRGVWTEGRKGWKGECEPWRGLAGGPGCVLKPGNEAGRLESVRGRIPAALLFGEHERRLFVGRSAVQSRLKTSAPSTECRAAGASFHGPPRGFQTRPGYQRTDLPLSYARVGNDGFYDAAVRRAGRLGRKCFEVAEGRMVG